MSQDNQTCSSACDCAGSSASETATERATYRRPAYTARESADAFDVEVFVPGVDRSGVEVSLEDDILTVTARRAAATPEAWQPLRREILTDDFRLSLALNVAVDEAKIEATVADGVLRVRLPKAEQVKARRIDVR